MQITYDPDADAIYIELRPDKVGTTNEVAEGVYLDFDAAGEVRGIEILYASTRAPELTRGHLDLRWPAPAGSVE